jgi:hypothetical protein
VALLFVIFCAVRLIGKLFPGETIWLFDAEPQGGVACGKEKADSLEALRTRGVIAMRPGPEVRI